MARHKPVLKDEVKKFLAIKKNGLYIDTTVGGGGHAKEIIKVGGKVLGIDRDRKALEMAAKHLSSACFAGRQACPARQRVGYQTRLGGLPSVLCLAHGNFANLKKIAKKYHFLPCDGVLFDLGVSSYQLEEKGRGFSFSKDEPLDMRLDRKRQKITAAMFVNGLSKRKLHQAFRQIADEDLSWPIAQAIYRARRLKPIETTRQLAGIIEKVYRRFGRYKRCLRIHPATKVFLALRVLVNQELENLEKALPQAVEILRPQGRLVVISFHSGEDRIVKNFLKDKEKVGEAEILTKKPIKPGEKEIRENPRSRSAKLRALVKIQDKQKK